MSLMTLALENVRKRPYKSTMLITIIAILSFTILSGTFLVTCLNNGLSSLSSKLGADIFIVPRQINAVGNIQDILLNGSTDYFYMDSDIVDELSDLEIDAMTTHTLLASTDADCCSSKVQIIGYDPRTDFVIKPWIKDSVPKDLEPAEVVVGSNLDVLPGAKLSFYGVECTVKARLKTTGTNYDSCVFTTDETLHKLIDGSLKKGLNKFTDINPDEVISYALIKIDNPDKVDEVVAYINVMSDKFVAVKSTAITSNVAKSISGITKLSKLLLILIVVIIVLILFFMFNIILNTRRKDYAILNMLGLRSSQICIALIEEVFILSFLGFIIGTAVSYVIMFQFDSLLKVWFDLPMLMPDVLHMFAYTVVTFGITLAACALSSVVSVVRSSYTSVALALRG